MIRFSDGTGEFVSSAEAVTGTLPGTPLIGDWNGDGKADIAFDNSSTGAIDLHISTGDTDAGTATDFFQSYTSLPGWEGDDFFMADFNGDGVADIWHRADGTPVTNTLYTTEADASDPDVYTSDVITAVTDSLGVVTCGVRIVIQAGRGS